MKKIIMALALTVYMSSNVHALTIVGLTGEQLKNACSEDKTQVGFLFCIAYLGGWWDGVEAQWFHIYFLNFKAGANYKLPPWAEKAMAHQCRDSKTSDEELAEKYVSWFNSKISTMRASDVESFKKRRAGDQVRNMLREIYFCKVTDILKSPGISGGKIGEGLDIRNVKSAREIERGVDVLVVRGEIANVSDEEHMVPMIRVVLFDSAGEELQSAVAVPLKNRLPAGAKISFNAKLPEPSALARRLEVTFSESKASSKNN